MSSSGSGRRRATDRLYSAEDQALDQISKEAEERIQARRQARAEAREIRMKEIERQQKEEEEKQKRQEGIPETPKSISSLSGSRRGSNDSTDTDASSKDSRDPKDQVRDVKRQLRELEDKYKQAMVTNAQLDNIKTSHVFQLELLKEQLEEQEESLTETNRQYKDKCRDYEMMKRDFESMKIDLNGVKQFMEIKDKLLQESGLVIVAEEDGQLTLTKCADKSSIPAPTLGASIITEEAAELLKKAGEGTLGKTSVKPVKDAVELSVDRLDKCTQTDNFSAVDTGIVVGEEFEEKVENVDKNDIFSKNGEFSTVESVEKVEMGETGVDEIIDLKDECKDVTTKYDCIEEVNMKSDVTDGENIKGESETVDMADTVGLEKQVDDKRTEMLDVDKDEAVSNNDRVDEIIDIQKVEVDLLNSQLAVNVSVIVDHVDDDDDKSDNDHEDEVFFDSQSELVTSPGILEGGGEITREKLSRSLHAKGSHLFSESCMSIESDRTYHRDSDDEMNQLEISEFVASYMAENNGDAKSMSDQSHNNSESVDFFLSDEAGDVDDLSQDLGRHEGGLSSMEGLIDADNDKVEDGEVPFMSTSEFVRDINNDGVVNASEGKSAEKTPVLTGEFDEVFNSVTETVPDLGDKVTQDQKLFAKEYVMGIVEKSVDKLISDTDESLLVKRMSVTAENIDIRILKRHYSEELVEKISPCITSSLCRGSVDILSPITTLVTEKTEGDTTEDVKFVSYMLNTDADLVLSSQTESNPDTECLKSPLVSGYGVFFTGNDVDADIEGVVTHTGGVIDLNANLCPEIISMPIDINDANIERCLPEDKDGAESKEELVDNNDKDKAQQLPKDDPQSEELGKNEAGELAKNESEEVGKNEAGELAKNESEEVGKNEAGELAKNESEEVGKNEAGELAKNESEEVGKNEAGELAKNESEEVGKNEAGELAKNESEEVGKNELERLENNESEKVRQNESEEIENNDLEEIHQKEDTVEKADAKASNKQLEDLSEPVQDAQEAGKGEEQLHQEKQENAVEDFKTDEQQKQDEETIGSIAQDTNAAMQISKIDQTIAATGVKQVETTDLDEYSDEDNNLQYSKDNDKKDLERDIKPLEHVKEETAQGGNAAELVTGDAMEEGLKTSDNNGGASSASKTKDSDSLEGADYGSLGRPKSKGKESKKHSKEEKKPSKEEKRISKELKKNSKEERRTSKEVKGLSKDEKKDECLIS